MTNEPTTREDRLQTRLAELQKENKELKVQVDKQRDTELRQAKKIAAKNDRINSTQEQLRKTDIALVREIRTKLDLTTKNEQLQKQVETMQSEWQIKVTSLKHGEMIIAVSSILSVNTVPWGEGGERTRIHWKEEFTGEYDDVEQSVEEVMALIKEGKDEVKDLTAKLEKVLSYVKRLCECDRSYRYLKKDGNVCPHCEALAEIEGGKE